MNAGAGCGQDGTAFGLLGRNRNCSWVSKGLYEAQMTENEQAHDVEGSAPGAPWLLGMGERTEKAATLPRFPGLGFRFHRIRPTGFSFHKTRPTRSLQTVVAL